MKKLSLTLLIALVALSVVIPNPVMASVPGLADKLVGEYKGKLRNQSVDLSDYKIKITKVSDTKVRIGPKTGTQSETFDVELLEEQIGSITVIRLKFATDHLLNNGMFVESNGRLSYSLHLGGEDMRNIEVFSGEKLAGETV